MGRIVAWLMIITGSVILGFNGYKFWGELNIVVQDPKVAMTISDDWQETEIEPSLTTVENLNTGEEETNKENNEKNEKKPDGGADKQSKHEETGEKIAKRSEHQSNTTNVSSDIETPKITSQNPKVGSNIGQLIIPKIGAYLPVVEGTDDQSLERGVGKYRGYGTVAPDQTGHVVLSGHRDTVFRKLGQLKTGDKLYVKYKAHIYTYQIRKTWITHAEDRTVIVPIDRPVLTVTTCYPFDYKGNAPDRYIIRADLIKIKKA